MRVSSNDLFKLAYGRFAIGAYNVQNMEQVLGVFRGSLMAQAPVLVAVVPFAREYAGPEMIEGMVSAAEKMYPDVVYAMHLDHGDEPSCWSCIDSGFYSSIMIDASHKPFDENVAITRQVVEKAHARGIEVEAELGMVGGLEGRPDVDNAGDAAPLHTANEHLVIQEGRAAAFLHQIVQDKQVFDHVGRAHETVKL